MKKFVCFVLGLALLGGVLALPAGAVGFTPPFEPAAPAAYVVNTDSNIIVYEKNSEQPLPAASLTKLMTAILLLENYQDELDTVTAAPDQSIQDYVYIHGGSHADIRPGEEHTMRQLLYAMMLPSANEAALAVGKKIAGGSLDNFVYMMNARAKEIGCTGTAFTDACGLDEGNTTTARDAYLLLRYAMSFDVFKEVCRTATYDMGENPRYSPGGYIIQSTDRMISSQMGGSYYRSYTQGGKTGSLGDWQNFASWHTGGEGGETYICVVLGSPNSVDPYEYPTKRPALYETGLLMDWVFENFAIQPALKADDAVYEVPVKYSTDGDTLMLWPKQDLLSILPLGTDETVTQKTFNVPESVAAPIRQGDVVGTVSVSLSGEVIGVVELVAGRDMARNPVLYTLSKVGEFFGSLYFKVVLVLSALAVAVYLILYVYWLAKRRGSKKKVRRRQF